MELETERDVIGVSLFLFQFAESDGDVAVVVCNGMYTPANIYGQTVSGLQKPAKFTGQRVGLKRTLYTGLRWVNHPPSTLRNILCLQPKFQKVNALLFMACL